MVDGASAIGRGKLLWSLACLINNVICQRSAGCASTVSCPPWDHHDKYRFTIALHDLSHTTSPMPSQRTAIYPCSRRRRHARCKRYRTRAPSSIPAKVSSLNFLGLCLHLASDHSLTVAEGTSGRGQINRNCKQQISSTCVYSRLQMPMGRRECRTKHQAHTCRHNARRNAVRLGYQMAYMYRDPELQTG